MIDSHQLCLGLDVFALIASVRTSRSTTRMPSRRIAKAFDLFVSRKIDQLDCRRRKFGYKHGRSCHPKRSDALIRHAATDGKDTQRARKLISIAHRRMTATNDVIDASSKAQRRHVGEHQDARGSQLCAVFHRAGISRSLNLDSAENGRPKNVTLDSAAGPSWSFSKHGNCLR
jgi:hypothetical protein